MYIINITQCHDPWYAYQIQNLKLARIFMVYHTILTCWHADMLTVIDHIENIQHGVLIQQQLLQMQPTFISQCIFKNVPWRFALLHNKSTGVHSLVCRVFLTHHQTSSVGAYLGSLILSALSDLSGPDCIGCESLIVFLVYEDDHHPLNLCAFLCHPSSNFLEFFSILSFPWGSATSPNYASPLGASVSHDTH